jgi:hypothetical protein
MFEGERAVSHLALSLSLVELTAFVARASGAQGATLWSSQRRSDRGTTSTRLSSETSLAAIWVAQISSSKWSARGDRA